MPRLYQHVTNGTVDRIAATLPRSWNTAAGEILAFHLVSNPEDYGFYPWSDAPIPEHDTATHKATPRDVIDATARTSTRVWDIVALTPAEITANLPPIPDAVTPLQMRKALRSAGLRPSVDAYLATLSDEAVEAWEYCVEVRRGDPFIVDAVAALGMTSKQRDDLFVLAATF